MYYKKLTEHCKILLKNKIVEQIMLNLLKLFAVHVQTVTRYRQPSILLTYEYITQYTVNIRVHNPQEYKLFLEIFHAIVCVFNFDIL